MRNDEPYTCMETCGQEKPCGNRYCSAHPKHFAKKKPNHGTKKPGYNHAAHPPDHQ